MEEKRKRRLAHQNKRLLRKPSLNLKSQLFLHDLGVATWPRHNWRDVPFPLENGPRLLEHSSSPSSPPASLLGTKKTFQDTGWSRTHGASWPRRLWSIFLVRRTFDDFEPPSLCLAFHFTFGWIYKPLNSGAAVRHILCSLWSVVFDWWNYNMEQFYSQLKSIGVWNCHKHAGCTLYVISWISYWL